MAACKNPNKGLIDSLAALRAAIGHQRYATPTEARNMGYIPAKEYADAEGISRSHAMGLMARAVAEGKVEFVTVKEGRAMPRWYRAK